MDNKTHIDILEGVLALTPCHVYWKDRKGVILGCNNNNAAFLKLNSPKEIVGKTTYDFQPSDVAKAVEENDEFVMSTGQSFESTENAFGKDGKLQYFLSNKVPLTNKKGEVIGLVGISVDITKEREREQELIKAKEKAEAANLAKSEFLANMSHELRTPLNGILGMAQLLGFSKNLDEEDRSKVDDLISSGNILLELINDVLNFARAEAGKIAMQSVPIQLPELVGKTIKSLSPLAIEKNLVLTSELTHQCPAIIISDPLRIRQILTNLVGNALKFTDEGRVNVAVDVTEQNNENITLQFSVEDTGCGIPLDQLELIFERFHQVNSSYKTTKVGTGLGLALVKKLVGELNGTVGVHSSVGAGSVFYFTIPCKVQIMHDSSGLSQKLMEALRKKSHRQLAVG